MGVDLLRYLTSENVSHIYGHLGWVHVSSISARGLEGTAPYPAALCGASDLSFTCDDLVFGFVSVFSSGYVWVIPSPPVS